MKRQVWKNKSNQQLCVTVPKGSGIGEGDIVTLKKDKIGSIAYSFVVADLFHYGHLQLLQKANSLADLHICGVLTDKGAASYRERPITNYAERAAIIQSLQCVDMVMPQKEKDPTENLKRIHGQFPRAKLIIVHGTDWQEVPGAEYVRSLGGEVIQPEYYKRLAPSSILSGLSAASKDLKTFEHQYFKVQNMISLSAGKQRNVISTKANTLMALQPLLKNSRIEETLVFTVADWAREKEEILKKIGEVFGNGTLVVRSSALNEDTFEGSMAGCFYSELGVPGSDGGKISKAIQKVIGSYESKGKASLSDQILIQEQTKDIALSGVVFTRTLHKNAPYYTINFDGKTKATDAVTKGVEQETVFIARWCDAKDIPEKWRALLKSIREIEGIIPHISLDIEFAIGTDGKIVIYQVRPMAAGHSFSYDHEAELKEFSFGLKERFIALAKPKPHLEGSLAYFGDMPDWNPAEIIGDAPNYLDYSLYAYLIMDEAWHKARSSQGYHDVSPAKLMVLFGNKPYVNIRNTFNSFVPKSIRGGLRKKIMQFYLDKIRSHPELQDKVEFDVLYTCYDLTFPRRCQELAAHGFSGKEIEEIKNSLVSLTNTLILEAKENIRKDKEHLAFLAEARRALAKKAEKEESPKALVNIALELLEDCRAYGTVEFSRLARLAFIGKIILKSLVKEGIVAGERYSQFLSSIQTVASKMSIDFLSFMKGKIGKKDFLALYGHLRPGTYDITSRRYDENPELISKQGGRQSLEEGKPSFSLTPEEEKKITGALQSHGLKFDAGHLFWFIQAALEERESSKFEFTKNISDALKLIAAAGQKLGFTREGLAQLDVDALRSLASGDEEHIKEMWKSIISARARQRELQNLLILPPIIFSPQDFDCISYYAAQPNFVTSKKIMGRLVNLSAAKEKIPDIGGKIAAIENADPGYDWIFTKGIAGLITKYGGVASHMSIRCAEFNLPAAIGCGSLYDQMIEKESITLDCAARKIFGGAHGMDADNAKER